MHITLAGRLGSGKSTVCEVMRERYGFEVYSTGAIQREMAKRLNLDTIEMNRRMAGNLEFDHMIDDATTKLAAEQSEPPIIFDSRMAWHFAPVSFKVYMTVDPMTAARRVYNTRRSSVESYGSPEEAKAQLINRANLENERFKDIYGVDNYDYRNYDLVIDATFSTPDSIAEAIYARYTAYRKAAFGETEILLSPKSLYPMRDGKSDGVTVAPLDGYHFIVSGAGHVLEALAKGTEFLTARLCPPDSLTRAQVTEMLSNMPLSVTHDFETVGNFRYESYPEYYAT